MKKLLLFINLTIVSSLIAQNQWDVQNTGFSTANRGIQSISAVNDSVVWAIAYDGTTAAAAVQEFTKTMNGGITWTPGSISNAAGFTASSIFALDANNAWVAMYGTAGGGRILKTTNGGTSWTHQSTATFTAPNGFANWVYFFNANEGVCMGDPNGGYFEYYTTADGGNNWTRVPQTNVPTALASEYGLVNSYCAVGNILWMGTTAGRVFKSINNGLNWTAQSTPFGPTVYVEDVSFKNTNEGMAIGLNANGTFAGLIKTTDGGNTWTIWSTPISMTSLRGVEFVKGSDDSWVVTSSNTPFGSAYTNDGGLTWTIINNTQHLTTAFASPRAGYSGGFNTSSTVGGMFKWNAGNIPTVNFTDTTVCQGSSLTLTASLLGAGTIQWYSSADGTVPLAVGNTYTLSNIQSNTQVWVASVLGNNLGFKRKIQITAISPAAGPTISGATNICSGNTTTLTALGQGTIKWYDAPINGNLLFTGNPYITPVLSQSQTYYVEQTIGTCTSLRSSINVNVGTTPPAPMVDDVNICNGQTASLSYNGVGTIKWYVSQNSTTPIFTGNNFVTSPLTNTTSFWVEASLASCASLRDEVVVNVNSFPSVPTISGSNTAVAGVQQIFTVSAQTGVVFNWTAQNATPTSGTGETFTTTFNTGGINIVTVTAENTAGCERNANFNVQTSGVSLEEYQQNVFRVYPNPSTNIIYIQSPFSLDGAQISVYDISGKRVLNAVYLSTRGQSIAELTDGLYFIELQKDGKNYRNKVIKH
jgi:hypothetical protein